MTLPGLRQAWCTRPGCRGGAMVGADCPVEMLSCIACGSDLTFEGPKRSTRGAATRCIRCGALGRATVVNIPVGCAEPVDVTCGWREQRVCPVGRERAAGKNGGAK